MKTASNRKVTEQFDDLFHVLSSDRFLAKEGLGNEVPFFVFPFAPEIQNEVDSLLPHLVRRLESAGISILDVNLYDLSVEIIERRGKWDQLLRVEATMSKDRFKTQVQNLTDVETKLIPAIAERIEEYTSLQLLFLTGVGLVYPFIRTHNVLSNLQKVAKEYPTLLFFPGFYSFTEGKGQFLDLFGELNEDRYYRAFNIEDYRL